MTYQEARGYIGERGKLGSVLGLETMTRLMDRLGNPQDQLKIVHVAGTNGKGSTVAILASILDASGYRVGCYNSPAVFDVREQIRVNGKWIGEEDVAEGIDCIKAAITQMEQAGEPGPTSFEVETALAFWYFAKCGCEIGVIEVGLGGDLDATNIVKSTVCSVITSLSYDHMGILGNTLEEIALHKAGILRPMTPAVLDTFGETPERKRAWDVIREECRKKKVCLYTTEPYEVQFVGVEDGRQIFHYRKYWNLKMSMAGRYQVYNACLAIEAADELARQGMHITEQDIRVGIERASWPGRFERIHSRPTVILDGAHNPGGAARLRESLDLYFTNKRILYIMGVLGDKDYQDVIRITHSAADLIYTVTPPNPRALPAKQLAEAVSRFHDPKKVRPCEGIEETLTQALEEAGEEDVILAFGSLYYLGDLKRCLDALDGQRADASK